MHHHNPHPPSPIYESPDLSYEISSDIPESPEISLKTRSRPLPGRGDVSSSLRRTAPRRLSPERKTPPGVVEENASREMLSHYNTTSESTSLPAASLQSPGLLPPLPINAAATPHRSPPERRPSPPYTPPYVTSAQYSTPLRQIRSFVHHPWDTPDASVPSSSISPVRRRVPTTPTPGSQSLRRPPFPETHATPRSDEIIVRSPERWQRESFTRGGVTEEEPEQRLDVIVTEEGRVVDADVEMTRTGADIEDRTPSPYVEGAGAGPSTPRQPVQLAASPETPRQSYIHRPEYMIRQTPITRPSPTMASPGRRPETRPARPHKRTASQTLPQRTTRARDAKEAKEAIAMVDAYQRGEMPITPRNKGKERAQESHYDDPNTGIGIAVSPMKGRRLKLLRRPLAPNPAATSNPLNHWLANAVPPPQPAPPSPKAIDWGRMDLTALGIHIDPGDPELKKAVKDAERESKKRKRLEAFLEDDGCGGGQPRKSPLKPALVDGVGRMAIHPLVNALEGGRSIALEPATGIWTGMGRSKTWPRKRPPPSPSPPRARNQNLQASIAGASNHRPLPSSKLDLSPGWPDAQYPWSISRESRRRMQKEQEQEKLKAVEAFLGRESDDSESEDESEARSASTVDDDTVHGARGLWALAQQSDPALTPADIPSTLFTISPSPVAPSDPSDARYALASRRDVRSALFLAAQRRQAQLEMQADVAEDEDEEGDVNCICGGPDDGRAMVRCDACRTWSHQDCVNIQDESELGESWFCDRCNGSVTAPTLVHGDGDTPTAEDQAVERRNQIFLQPMNRAEDVSPTLLPSGSLSNTSSTSPWPFPKTPKPSALNSSGRSWGDLRTPRFSNSFPDASYPQDVRDNLDPLSTPSRGTKYGMPFVSTGIGTTTPKATSSGKPPPDSGSTLRGGHSDFSPPTNHYSYNETPIQRSRNTFPGLAPAFLVESRDRKVA